MNQQSDITELLALISQPAFYAADDIIALCNDAAARILLEPGISINHLFPSDVTEFEAPESGCLFLSLFYNGSKISASVSKFRDGYIFILDPEGQRKELKTLALTAANMRQPISTMIATAANLSPLADVAPDTKTKEYMEQMNRSLRQMHRMLCNMSDAVQYADGHSDHMTYQNIISVIEGIFQHAQILAQHNNIALNYTVPSERVLCVIDEQLLERAIYNMLSNALKHSENGGSIEASVVRKDKTVYISITDHGPGIPPHILNNVFQRYKRQPGIECGTEGLGLGLVMVRSAAMVHGGTVLIDSPKAGGTRITMSIPIRHNADTLVRSDIITVDYAGGYDHALLELSDVLPAHLYQIGN